MMIKKMVCICLLCSPTMSQALPKAHKHKNCAVLHLQISNLTKSACILTSHKEKHGNLITPPPMSILPNDSKRFDMKQTIYGPSVQLSYQCGDENITITSQQNLCYWEAGNIHGKTEDPKPENIFASFEAIPGSEFHNRSGSINWKIQSFAKKTKLSNN